MHNDAPDQDGARKIDPRRIVVIGPCGSGKTTLVDRLQALGYDARVVAQEHSIVRDLWSKRGADVLVALDLDLATLRIRRSPTWSADIFALQHDRLASAVAHVDLKIDTTTVGVEDALQAVVEWLDIHR